MKTIHQLATKPHACVIDIADEIRMHTAMDQDAVSICMEIADDAQQVACETVRDLFEFWRIIQGAGIDAAHVLTHYEIFKGCGNVNGNRDRSGREGERRGGLSKWKPA